MEHPRSPDRPPPRTRTVRAHLLSALRIPWRTWKAFRILHTVFLIVRGKERFLLLRPLPPAVLKNAILDLGVCFIKLAQVLATRADFFSREYLVELRTIHDEVAPMPVTDLETMYERAFGNDAPFIWFEQRPIASASIGQVHAALLPGDVKVAVKIRRLHIERRVRVDLRILHGLLFVFTPFFSRYTRNSLEAIITEFSSMIVREVDMNLERENLRIFRETYGHMDVRLPEFHAEHSSADALVMSFEHGTRIDAVETLQARGIDFGQLMHKVIEFYTEQMLVKGFFHCDPHPGNLLVRDDGQLVLLDYGMVKRLPEKTRIAMIEYAKAAHDRDYDVYVAACKRLGVVAASAPEDEIREFAERMFAIFSNENLTASSMQALAFDVLDSMRDLPFKLPQEVIYVLRASALIEGLGTNFLDNYNGVKDILPQLVRNLDRAMGEDFRLFPVLKREVTSLPLTLRRVKTIVTDLSDGALRVRLNEETLEAGEERLARMLRPVVAGVALILAGIFLQGASFPGHAALAWICFGAGVLRLAFCLR
ncbi:AarF/ABC1/UbiB kinase family protein [Oceanidesulfovibrio indonesiensis]|uniref:AarF/ABC1/UbiB kinase family protein n=1 Tax=Oceanidesulfovibrio indonesiensis TaxID=54767 RepID=A0A7M3MGR4_9BACT|nr:AarF/UbiB family protein [Oceanidesulfovibrio indonesiensis]TVM18659.1 AarF/ABC1/UbiB kinase family protein [Oceanidesulfovibrio indonesiensis]